MVSKMNIAEKPELRDPVLIEGLPGIGLVANIAVAYLIKRLDAKFFGEILLDSFPDIAVTGKEGSLKSPFCRLYYYKGKAPEERDLILVYGNTQALTRRGQYELCGSILDIAEKLGCRYVITLGGYRPGRPVTAPNLYYAASDIKTAQLAENLGAKILSGQIFGAAGILVGLASLRGMKSFCLLAETPGNHPDKEAAASVLKVISEHLGLNLNLKDLTEAGDLAEFLAPFDFGALSEKKEKRETKPEWFI